MPDAAHIASGKVRELFALDDERLLLVASDRISTFDVVLPTEIPDKGRVLTGLSAYWFARTSHICAESPDRGPGGRTVIRVRAPRDAAARVRRPRVSHRLRLEGLPPGRRRLRPRAPSPGSSSPNACRRRSSLRRRKPSRATTRTSTPHGRSRSSARSGSGSSSASRSRCTSSARRMPPSAGSSSPTRSSSSA